MNNQYYQMPMMQGTQPVNYTILTEPYVFDALRMIIGRSVVIETVRGNIQGILTDVKPDHVVVRAYDNDTVFFIRTQQIVHVMPD